MCRTNHRATGRSKTGLQITVPRRDTAVPMPITTNGALTNKSILYNYASSSSSGKKTTSSFGAIGDHLPSAKTGRLSEGKASGLHKAQSGDQVKSASATSLREYSSITDLVVNSIPEKERYKLMAAGEIGPCSQHTEPSFILPSQLPLLRSRRRSLSDLTETHQKGILSVEERGQMSSSIGLQGPVANDEMQSKKTSADLVNDIVQSLSPDANVSDTVPIWRRAGPPFVLVYLQATGVQIHPISFDDGLDPLTFQLPFDVSTCADQWS